jgi:hypothetical protein
VGVAKTDEYGRNGLNTAPMMPIFAPFEPPLNSEYSRPLTPALPSGARVVWPRNRPRKALLGAVRFFYFFKFFFKKKDKT